MRRQELSPATIEKEVLQLGERFGDVIRKEAIVVGSAAIRASLTELTARELSPQDIDLAVSPEGYGYLRQQPDLREVRFPDGVTRLRTEDGLFDIGIGGQNVSHEELKQRSWGTTINIAGLPDLSAWKQTRNLAKDRVHMQLMRTYLLDPTRKPFPAHMLPRELAIASTEKFNHPNTDRARLLAANGLVRVFTLYGDRQIRRANQIIGKLEREEYRVPATYHNGFGVEKDMDTFQRQLKKRGASAGERTLALATDPYTDSNFGDDRINDERASAKLLYAHARALGFSRRDAERMRAMVIGTTFNEATGSQAGFDDADPLVREMTAVDLSPLSEESLESAFDITAEDSMSARASKERIVGRVIVERNLRPTSTRDVLAAVDEYANARPRGARRDSPTALQALATRFGNGADFHENYQPPRGYLLDNPKRRSEKAARIREIRSKLMDDRGRPGKMKLVKAYDMVVEKARS
jgi:hypothetical protein